MTTETTHQLVSFGNFLLEKYKVMVYSNDGTNIPIYQRMVSNADLENWKEEYDKSIIENSKA